jgi:hypothetical protein
MSSRIEVGAVKRALPVRTEGYLGIEIVDAVRPVDGLEDIMVAAAHLSAFFSDGG